MTDADAKTVAWHREEAAGQVERARGCRARADASAAFPYKKVLRAEADASDVIAAHHTRAADAIEIISLENEQSARLLTKLQAADDRADALAEENARLRDMLDDTVGALEALCGERPAWQYLLDEVRTELRKPDAVGGEHE